MRKDGELLCRYDGNFYSFRCGVSINEESARAKRKFIRRIENNNSIKTWNRLALLPNVEDQKYTFGHNSFTRREEQGEFIFLPKSSGVPEGSSLCEINVKNGKYFLTPLLKDGEVCLNGVKLLKRTELKFGDCLILGDKSTPLLFKERELRPEMFLYSAACAIRAKQKEKEEAEKSSNTKKQSENKPKNCSTNEESEKEPVFNGEFTPGYNNLILSEIFRHLPLSDVKNCRLVAKLWAEEGIKILRKEGTLSLDYRWDNDHVTQSMKLFQYSLEMGNSHPIPNWSIKLPRFDKEDGYRIVNKSKGMPGAKLLSDLDFYLFKEKFSVVHKLKLGGDICFKFDYELRIKILQTFQDTLTELTLAGAWRIEIDPPRLEKTGREITFPENLFFPNLQTFALHINAVKGTRFIVQDCSKMTWFRNLVLAITPVTSIRIRSEEQTAGTFLDYLCQNSALFSNLQEIKLFFANSPTVTLLLKLEKSLKKLELWNCHNLKIQEFPLITELLLKHSNSLEKLVMNFPNESWEEQWTTPVVINFPAMHKLQILSLGFWDKTGRFKLSFPDGIINYGKDFPCLKSLTLWSREGKNFKSVCETFFLCLNKNPLDAVPDEDFCTSLQILEVDLARLHKGSKIVSIFTLPQLFNIATMFPNISNGDWIDARKSSVLEEIKKQELEQELSPRKLRPRKDRKKK